VSVESASEFAERRRRLNELVLEYANLPMKRFLALDHDAYEDGALPKRTKELLGLVASTVLRCNDCISYHVGEAVAAGVSVEEITEALGVALVVGGSIAIPHVRHAFEVLDSIEAGE